MPKRGSALRRLSEPRMDANRRESKSLGRTRSPLSFGERFLGKSGPYWRSFAFIRGRGLNSYLLCVK